MCVCSSFLGGNFKADKQNIMTWGEQSDMMEIINNNNAENNRTV